MGLHITCPSPWLKNFVIKQSYWSKAKTWTQRVWIKEYEFVEMKCVSVTPLSHQILDVSAQKKHPNLRKEPSHLSPILSPRGSKSKSLGPGTLCNPTHVVGNTHADHSRSQGRQVLKLHLLPFHYYPFTHTLISNTNSYGDIGWDFFQALISPLFFKFCIHMAATYWLFAIVGNNVVHDTFDIWRYKYYVNAMIYYNLVTRTHSYKGCFTCSRGRAHSPWGRFHEISALFGLEAGLSYTWTNYNGGQFSHI